MLPVGDPPLPSPASLASPARRRCSRVAIRPSLRGCVPAATDHGAWDPVPDDFPSLRDAVRAPAPIPSQPNCGRRRRTVQACTAEGVQSLDLSSPM
ncbi:hypothetical protein ACP70R_046069 [Stipagrostis hirtigluma subsp. patula]